ncbi:tRNA:m(4)X modification enzyme TRM13-like protein [Rhynchospora pubera]|uniref:tRNA:m(4)X modification enzyme TRM13 n=1 Tax=Rhynchospora pubera TaxID=906938 RepID=A0AAV8HSM8_9POAL|nr:tRNA:m(4)X modification enzyme TRM13-like protein [Rhynchospora pubera]
MSGELETTASRCHFWLPNKRRHCANTPLPSSVYCGNHNPSSAPKRVPCPIDPSHTVLQDSLELHVKRCPFKKQVDALEAKPYYSKSINAGDSDEPTVSSADKRGSIHRLSTSDFWGLINKIKSVHSSVVQVLRDSYLVPESCEKWLKGQLDKSLPYQEKHVVQQASILGNMESFGILQKENNDAISGTENSKSEVRKNDVAVVEFGAGRGYLTQMLADCYSVRKVFLIERRSYKLKADRSLRQNESLALERLRIDIEDLNLCGVDSLKGVPYLATGKHLCGPATDLTINCCMGENRKEGKGEIKGLAIATCCHHLCQWKHYKNKKFLSDIGINKKEFHAMTWFSSWAVDGDHSSDDPSIEDEAKPLKVCEKTEAHSDSGGIERIIRSMPAIERAAFGFMCKEIIDTGRLLWLKENEFDAQLVSYVPFSISPENHLLIAKKQS